VTNPWIQLMLLIDTPRDGVGNHAFGTASNSVNHSEH